MKNRTKQYRNQKKGFADSPYRDLLASVGIFTYVGWSLYTGSLNSYAAKTYYSEQPILFIAVIFSLTLLALGLLILSIRELRKKEHG